MDKRIERFRVEDMYVITPGGFAPITGAITPNDELIRLAETARQ